MSADRFGVPDGLLGQHDEDFYGALGRVASLSALLEYQALTTYQTMTDSPQAAYARLSADQLLTAALAEAESLEDGSSRRTLLDYFTSVKTLLQRRNDFIHSVWPAQPGDRLFGWRPSRAKPADFDPAEPTINVETTLDDLVAFIHSLVALIQERDRASLAARTEQDRRRHVAGDVA